MTKIKFLISYLVLFLSILTLFMKILLLNKISIITLLIIVFLLLNPNVNILEDKNIKYIFLSIMIIIIPLSYYFGINNYKIKRNPILYEETYDNILYKFNNLEATFYINGNGPTINFEGQSFIYWKKYFKGIENLKVSDGINTIGNLNFYKAHALTNVETFDNIKGIGIFSFGLCEKLEKFNSDKKGVFIMPKELEIISSGAFYGCQKIKKVYLYKNIKLIADEAFSGCLNLTEIYYEGTKDEWDEINIDKSNINENINIYFNCLPTDL